MTIYKYGREICETYLYGKKGTPTSIRIYDEDRNFIVTEKFEKEL